jgi:NhaA family Na+:H+ antiporter
MSSKTPADTASLQTRLERGFERAVTPFQAFIAEQTTTSIALIICTVLALALANSPLAHDYEALFETTLGVVYSDWSLIMPLRHWINEGLMALFFFLLGLEIKRELLVGELNAGRRAITVIAAALGGMLVPATIFFMLNAGGEFAHGWGIPMATDTAFAVGILALLDKRIPSAALTFLVALAIIDDLGAILVIAVFYSDGTSVARLAVAAGILLALIACNALGIRRPAIYVLGGVLVWAALLGSGVHATVAGVLVAIENDRTQSQPMLGQEEQHLIAEDVREAAELATTPLRRWEHALEHPVALLVLPVFALANAGITVDIDTAATLWTDTLVIGIVLGLVVGKGLGIPLLTWLVTRLKLGELPPDVNMRHIVGVGLLGGMGFTMSIFIARLGFNTEPEAMQAAKIGILLASLIAGLAGYCWLRLCCKR